MSEFDVKVSKWVRETTQRMEAVFKESSKRVVRIAQVGVPHIPVDLGFARASIRASAAEMPKIDSNFTNKEGQTYPYDEGDVILTINGITMGQTLFVGWTASYVGELEKGHSQQAPSGFVRLAALQWLRIVREVSAELKQRATAQ